MNPNSNQADPVITLEGVSFRYGAQSILEDIHLTVYAGEFLAIVGPNGGGKTTLLKVILGLLRPQQGTVQVLGNAPGRSSRHLGYTPQHSAYDPHFPVSVLDVVLMGRVEQHLGGRYGAADREAALQALHEMALSELAGRPFAELSGGQRQRVLIARALVSDPKILLLDEPTSNMDAVVGNSLLALLKTLNRRMTILMVSHDFGFVTSAVTSVLCVNGTASIHPTSEISGDAIQAMYGDDFKLIRHDHRCAAEGHRHA